MRYLDQNLHRTPDRLPGIIQEQIDDAAENAGMFVLGYGLCSGGIVGVSAPKQPLAIPRVHDCIALFLGSGEAYHREFSENPGTYYMTAGWVAEEQDPLGYMERDYVPRVGREDAEWALREELKHYSRIALVLTDTGDEQALRKRGEENARFLDKKFEVIKGSRAFFEKMLHGPYDEGDFVVLQPGEKVVQNPFMT
ncbi:MAG: DUF1638 domain-containing protein [Desulfatibacillaceae bacterium]